MDRKGITNFQASIFPVLIYLYNQKNDLQIFQMNIQAKYHLDIQMNVTNDKF